MSINSLSKASAEKIARELSLPLERQQIIEYGMIDLLSQLLSGAVLLVVAYSFAMIKDVLMLAVCGALLRKYSGGAHCSSPMRCALLSSIVIPMWVLLARFLYGFGSLIYVPVFIIVDLISIAIIFVYSPKDSPSKPIRNREKIEKLKLKSVLLSIFISLISIGLFYYDFGQASTVISFGVFNQAFTLTKPGQRFIKSFDDLLKFIRI